VSRLRFFIPATLTFFATIAAAAELVRTEGEPLLFTGETRATATARLLRVPAEPPKLGSATGEVTYEAGRDFVWQPGTRVLTLTAESKIPFMTNAGLHPAPNSPNSYRAQRGTGAWMFFGPGRVMHDLQCAASYASGDDWRQPEVPVAPDTQLGGLRARLRAKQPVKIVMLGDSISTGADASAVAKAPPNQPGYPDLVARGIESRFGSKATLRNLSVGGMDSAWGVSKVADVISEKPDLLLVAFGMNDASGRRTPDDFAMKTRGIFEPVRVALPECSVILISSMTANSEWTGASPDLYPQYAAALGKLAGPGIAFADVTAMWTAIAERKKHMDLSGNGLNHPNDCGHRIYAEVILSVIGLP
jgi:acyl-CoA thioesterase I